MEGINKYQQCLLSTYHVPDAFYYREHSSQQPYWVGAIVCLSLPMRKLKPRKVKQFFQMARSGRAAESMGTVARLPQFPHWGD